jgi:hypothetical protein
MPHNLSRHVQSLITKDGLFACIFEKCENTSKYGDKGWKNDGQALMRF